MNLDFSERCRTWTTKSRNGLQVEVVAFNSGGALLQIFDGGMKIGHVSLTQAQLQDMANA